MISEVTFQTYLFLNNKQFEIHVINKITNKKIYSEKLLLKEDNPDLKFDKLNKFLEVNIFKIEKVLKDFIKDIYVILDSKEFYSVKLSIKKENNGKLINSETLIHPLIDLKNLCQSNFHDKKIIHFLIEKYKIDDKSYNSLPNNINCNIFSLDTEFICLPNYLIAQLEKVLSNYHILLSKILCANYVKKFTEKQDLNLFTTAGRIISGQNTNEVILVNKGSKNKGFFENFFDFFS